MLLERRKFTLDEYHQINIFGEDDRLELMDGEIISMSPIGRLHAACLKRLIFNFTQILGTRAIVSAQDPLIVLGSEPIPDIVLLHYRDDFYAGKSASAEDAHLVIEVSDSTLDYDQKVKTPKFARAGIPEVWIIDLNEGLIWVYRNPNHKNYLDIKAYKRDEHITLLAFQDITLGVNDILGPKL
jgi:Uma2 family endonuclease